MTDAHVGWRDLKIKKVSWINEKCWKQHGGWLMVNLWAFSVPTEWKKLLHVGFNKVFTDIVYDC